MDTIKLRTELLDAQKHLLAWKQAELTLATGQSYSIAGRSLTRVNLSDVMQQIRYWQRQCDDLEGKLLGLKPKSKMRQYVPIDQ